MPEMSDLCYLRKPRVLSHQHLKQYSTDFNLIVTLWITDIKQRYL